MTEGVGRSRTQELAAMITPRTLKHIVDQFFPACTHPDCGPRGNCASSQMHRRALLLAKQIRLVEKREQKRRQKGAGKRAGTEAQRDQLATLRATCETLEQEKTMREISRSANCSSGEHDHCGGIFKTADAENLDISRECRCSCHRTRVQYRCFHCNELFTTPGAAEDHFGKTPEAKTGCLIKVELGDERGLLMALRKAEATCATLTQERDRETELRRRAEEFARMDRQLADQASEQAEASVLALRDLRAKVDGLLRYRPDIYLYQGGVPGPPFMHADPDGGWVSIADVLALLPADGGENT